MFQTSLKDKTIQGVRWSAIDAFLGQGITFIVGIILARLLTPSDFGLIGIVTIFTTIFAGLVDCGFSNSLIRKKDINEADYNTMFLTNLVFSVVLYLLLFIVSPLIARFFVRPELVLIIRVSGLVLIIQALSIVQNTILAKKIDFKTKAKVSVISSLSSGIIGIGMAVCNFGVWALVCQLLSRQLLYSLFIWMFDRWRPRFDFSKDSFCYMWGYGWKLMLSGLLNNIWNQLYHVVVGGFYSPETLGQFSRSREYANLLSANFTSIVQRVTFPALSEIQNEKERLMAAYRKVIKTSMFVTTVALLSMAAVSEPLIYCLIGSQWHQAATYLPLICVSMTLYPLHAINLNMLQIQGRSDIFLALEITKKIIAIGPICLGIFLNIYWMLIGVVFVDIICFFLNSFYSGKELGYSSKKQMIDVLPSYAVGCIIVLTVYFFKFLPVSNFIILPIQIIVGMSVFFLLCKFFRIEEYQDIKSIAHTYISTIKKH